MTLTTHQISVGGVRQVYHVAGRGPICVAHSGGPGIDWAYLRMPLLEQRFTMVYLEPVGTGDSGRLPEYPLAAYVEMVTAAVTALGSSPVFVLGHSHGGFVMQQFALDHPSLVAGIVLYDTSPVTGPEFWDNAMAGVIAYGAVDPAVPAAFEKAVTAIDDDALSVALRQAVPVYFADFPHRSDEFAQFVGGVRAWAVPQDPKPFDVRSRLTEITAPTVIIVGRHDFICGPRWATMLHDGIPGARLVELPSSGHFGHIEQPDAFASAVIDLLG